MRLHRMNKLDLDQARIAECRGYAARIAGGVPTLKKISDALASKPIASTASKSIAASSN